MEDYVNPIVKDKFHAVYLKTLERKGKDLGSHDLYLFIAHFKQNSFRQHAFLRHIPRVLRTTPTSHF